MWAERFAGYTFEDVSPADLERLKTEHLESVSAATVRIDQKPDVRKVCGKSGAGGGS